jgi:hypothetical protein
MPNDAIGTTEKCRNVSYLAAIRGIADMAMVAPAADVAMNDPIATIIRGRSRFWRAGLNRYA